MASFRKICRLFPSLLRYLLSEASFQNEPEMSYRIHWERAARHRPIDITVLMLSLLALSNDRRWYGLLQLAFPLAFGFILTLVCAFAGNAQPANSGETEGQEQDTSTRALDPRGWSPCPMVASAAAAFDIP